MINKYGAVNGTRRTRIKSAPLPLCPPQAKHDRGSNPGRRGGKPAITLTYGTVYILVMVLFRWSFIFITSNIINRTVGLDSYSGGVQFESRPGHSLSLCFFMVFLGPSGQMLWIIPRLNHDRFLPHPFQFIIRPTIRRRIVCITYWQRRRDMTHRNRTQ
jgi:hypothetical protein